jgi:quercetin dioxygenase-like cupin family protein
MIHRRYDEGQKLDVEGLNEITVVLDRSQTARTEIGLTIWRAGLVGPPHLHEHKEQVFFVTRGSGWVTVGGERREVRKGDVIYVPAGIEHQTEASPHEALEYLLYNTFFFDEKEGHATFAEHIEKIKATRRAQADHAQVAGAGSAFGQ